MSKKNERYGVLFVLASAATWGIFPILVNQGTHNSIPPVLFAATTTLLAAGGAFIYALLSGKLADLKHTAVYSSLLMITLCAIVIPYTLFFIGSGKTSGLNSSSLLLSEIIFVLIFTPFIGEKTTISKLLGALGVFTGASLLLYNGTFHINTGDILIIFSTITYPIGNFYTKKVLQIVSSEVLLFARCLLGGLFMLVISSVTEQNTNVTAQVTANWQIILFTGVVLLGLGKILWYEGLKRLDISKATSLILTFPLFSILILVLIFHEQPSLFQYSGFAIMMLGVYFSVKRPSTDPALTKYKHI